MNESGLLSTNLHVSDGVRSDGAVNGSPAGDQLLETALLVVESGKMLALVAAAALAIGFVDFGVLAGGNEGF